MIERYGWPTYTAWAGHDEDTNHTTYLDGFRSPPMAPYTTFEYSLGRVHTIPACSAIANPFTLTDSDFTLLKENAKGAPVTKMKRGDIAVSDPALLFVDDNPLPAPSEALLDRMIGTVRLDKKSRRVGVYWETYGLSATDTVTVYVRVVADAQLSTLRRLGMGLNVVSNPNREIVQKWTEPDAQRGTRTLDGPIPVQMRTIMLNLTELQPGPYILEVGFERKDGSSASGRRRIVIER